MKKIILCLLTVVMCLSNAGAVYADVLTASNHATKDKELVIVLDPGHDSTHAGAGGHGLREENLVLSLNEQKLLRLLVANKGQLLTREVLIDRLWSDGGEFVDENALSVTVNRLRSKLENKGEKVTYIQTVYGQGYMWKRETKE